MRPATLVAIAAIACGCSTHYAPQPGARLSVVMSGGMPAYQKGGQLYPHGFAGSGLMDAVADDPEALEAAETYHDRNVGGLVALAAGLVCGVAGAAVISTDDPDDPDPARTAIGLGALACMLGGLITGTVLVATAQPYQWDALNIYNDHVDQRLHMLRCSPHYCPPVWPGYPAPAPAPLPPPDRR